MIGYACSSYAESLSEFGTPRILPRSEGWILERPIPGSRLYDAIGCYPLFKCTDWSKLHNDLDDMGDDLVSISMVPDPFGDYDEAYLRRCFGDLVVPFKQHYIADLHRPLDEIVSRHHRKCANKAQKQVQTEVCQEPEKFLDEWVILHKNLVSRHRITGIKAYSRLAFKRQLTTPGIVVLRALHEGKTVGAQLWFVHEDVAFGHVLAFTEDGYKLGASYALFWFALNYFKDRVRWCDYGGVAGLRDNDNSSLCQFKEGWSTGKQTAYFCGRILNRSKYAMLESLNQQPTGFFPAYRKVF